MLEIQTLDGQIAPVTIAQSIHNRECKYRLGETITVPDYCDEYVEHCKPGIYFYTSRQQAVEYMTFGRAAPPKTEELLSAWREMMGEDRIKEMMQNEVQDRE